MERNRLAGTGPPAFAVIFLAKYNTPVKTAKEQGSRFSQVFQPIGNNLIKSIQLAIAFVNFDFIQLIFFRILTQSLKSLGFS